MGMALKTDPSQIKTASVWKTGSCPLARIVRQGLRKRGFSGDFTTVYSTEQPKHNEDEIAQALSTDENISAQGRKLINGSIVTVTASAGLMLASLVLRDVLKEY
jgi:tRNA A37 threonylcarbamoyladenosine dehydratase